MGEGLGRGGGRRGRERGGIVVVAPVGEGRKPKGGERAKGVGGRIREDEEGEAAGVVTGGLVGGVALN